MKDSARIKWLWKKTQGYHKIYILAIFTTVIYSVMQLTVAFFRSSIDVKTEKALQAGLDAMLHGRTSFIIAHRLSTIKNCDKIMFVDQGRILECGNHEELMAKKGAYYKLYTSQ